MRSLGADDVVDYTRAEVTQRYDVVVDTAGSRSLTQLRRMLTPKGTLVIAGGEGGGKWIGTFHRSLRAPFVSMFVGQRLASGELVPVVSRTLPLSAAAEAIDHLEAGHTAGKQVLTV